MKQTHDIAASDQDPAPEVKRLVGTIAELWRYPVKSMLGGTVSELIVTGRGALGDRVWALRDQRTGRIVSAKRVPCLLQFQATYEVEPWSPGSCSAATSTPPAPHRRAARCSARGRRLRRPDVISMFPIGSSRPPRAASRCRCAPRAGCDPVRAGSAGLRRHPRRCDHLREPGGRHRPRLRRRWRAHRPERALAGPLQTPGRVAVPDRGVPGCPVPGDRGTCSRRGGLVGPQGRFHGSGYLHGGAVRGAGRIWHRR